MSAAIDLAAAESSARRLLAAYGLSLGDRPQVMSTAIADAFAIVAFADALRAAKIGRVEAEHARDALRRELDALRQTHTGDLARERERVEAAERECERRGAELARVRAAVRMHESAREQMDAHDRATLRSLAGDSRAVLIEELAGARRERDDWNARATSLEFERDAALADAAGLRAELAAERAMWSRPDGPAVDHGPCAVAGCAGEGSWRWPRVRGGFAHVCAMHHDAAARHERRSQVDEDEALDRAARDPWPVAAPDAATQRAGEGGADG